MIFFRDEVKEKIPAIVLDIFRRYVPDAPEDCIQRITERSGIALERLDGDNAGVFLECMRQELLLFTEDWKARFVTGVIRQMISRAAGAEGEEKKPGD